MSELRIDAPIEGCRVSMEERTDAERADDPTLDALTRLDRESMLTALYRRWGIADPAGSARADAAGDVDAVASDVDARLEAARRALKDYDAKRRDTPSEEPEPVDSETAKFNAMCERGRNAWRSDAADATDDVEPEAKPAPRERRDWIATVEKMLPGVSKIRPGWREMPDEYLSTLADEALRYAKAEGNS